MLTQTPSKIFRSDLAFWKKEGSCTMNEYAVESTHPNAIQIVREMVIEEDGFLNLQLSGGKHYFLLVLYGSLYIKELKQSFSAGDTFDFQYQNPEEFTVKNLLKTEKADFILLEIESLETTNFQYTSHVELNKKNVLGILSPNLPFRNYIGMFDGRREAEYSLEDQEKNIFGIVINGAFEVQNRLLESRDALQLFDIQTLEFEALSNNAILMFFEL